MSAAAAAATSAAIDGVLDKQEFEAAISASQETSAHVTESPVIVLEQPVAVAEPAADEEEQPVIEARQPAVLTYVQPTYVYGPLYTPGEEHSLITLTVGMRVVYTSRSNSQKYPATVVQRVPTGYLLKLDVDGGIKEVEDAEIWRVECEAESAEQSSQEATHQPTAEPLKAKTTKRASSKGKHCCCWMSS
eukprot:TRINITY_DN90719_c0_g1_i1.p1 TRINITY_DN90719_c0_g1~~TRINITY_DN90719_c0_g1_i1.p1  ORF type:complete len:190 (+),score=61.93 TRINITY_DN90719_c0_g1_i1:205-774(+)